MKPILILYATREGQTRRIAEHVAAEIRTRRLVADVRDVRAESPTLDLAPYRAAVLAASIHMGKHEDEMIAFVKSNREALERMPTAFLSVSLNETKAEDMTAPPEKRAEAHRAVQETIDRFFEQTGWRPGRVKPVAGALLYTKYNVLVRFIMKQISKRSGGSTDTSRDHEYTDWAALDRFVEEFVAELGAASD
jgi:menaquinone-dependent protoporphyrinogen oxidase